MPLRNYPVSRSEVCVEVRGPWHSPGAFIVAVPLDACEPFTSEGWPGEVLYRPIASLFADILAGPSGLPVAWGQNALPRQFRFSRECKHCGKVYLNWYHNQKTTCFCSNECRRRAKHTAEVARRARRRRDALLDRTCEHCGTRLDAARATRRYCSGRCRVAALRARRKFGLSI